MNTIFRITALLEGISTLLLFFFAMPMKYLADNPDYVPSIGMAHGVLWTAFVILCVAMKFSYKWPWSRVAILFAASFIPFLPFYVEKKYL
jgi:integral membrane protein